MLPECRHQRSFFLLSNSERVAAEEAVQFLHITGGSVRLAERLGLGSSASMTRAGFSRCRRKRAR